MKFLIMIFLKIYFGKTIIDDSVAGNVQGFKNFKIWPFLQILSFKLFLIAYTLSLCHIEAPHKVRNWPNFSWIQFDILDMVSCLPWFNILTWVLLSYHFVIWIEDNTTTIVTNDADNDSIGFPCLDSISGLSCTTILVTLSGEGFFSFAGP